MKENNIADAGDLFKKLSPDQQESVLEFLRFLVQQQGDRKVK